MTSFFMWNIRLHVRSYHLDIDPGPFDVPDITTTTENFRLVSSTVISGKVIRVARFPHNILQISKQSNCSETCL